MLKQRLITAAVLIPVIVWSLLTIPTQYIQFLFIAIAVLAAWEWLSIIGINKNSQKATIVSLMLVAGWMTEEWLTPACVLTTTLLAWLLATIIILVYAHKPLPEALLSWFRQAWFGVLTMGLLLIGFVTAAKYMHAAETGGPLLVLFVLVTVWLADTGGYFAGKRYGKHSLAKAISPNKTWEGVYGALLLSLIWALVFFFLLDNSRMNLTSWLLMTIAVVLISIVGDLFESVFKRCFDKKDSGNLLPGHGGVLDRIDSLLAAVPTFAAALLVSGAV